MSFHCPEKLRILTGQLASDASFGNNGAFFIPFKLSSKSGIWAIASDGRGWEHVSASAKNRTPSWSEMCRIKALFWDPEDVVVQYHPRESEYINCHPYTLHLWRPIGFELPTPPSILVGPKT